MLIVPTISGLNVPKWINAIRYLACLQFIAYLLFLDWEAHFKLSRASHWFPIKKEKVNNELKTRKVSK